MDEQELTAFEIAGLIDRQLRQEITSRDAERLEKWRSESEKNEQLFNQLSDATFREDALNRMLQFNAEAALNRINERIDTPVIPMYGEKWQKTRFAIAIAAACCLIVMSTVVYKYLHPHAAPISISKNHQDVDPGKSQAILTLANGKKVKLNAGAAGIVATQGTVQITNSGAGQLSYSAAGVQTSYVEYNTISTPNGGQYQILLPDGTKVWLNAASSLRYPTQFTGKERLVTLTGEGYFEVAHNRQMPFVVSNYNQQVRVLGTHFNIKCYTDEATVTTLLEGSVKLQATLNKSNKEYFLKPGQQAVQANNQIHIGNADIAQNLAWKDGQFIFHNTDLITIMRQAQRWYGVTVDLQTLPNEQFNAAISRNVKLSSLLQMLEETSNLKFKINERRIMLTK